MAAAQTQLEILRAAETLAGQLGRRAETTVKRNTFQSLVADFRFNLDVARLRRLLTALESGSGGHLKRNEQYRAEVLAATGALRRFLDQTDHSPAELATVFGWTARLLGTQARREASAGARAAHRRPDSNEPAQRTPDRPPGLGSIGLALQKARESPSEPKRKR